MTSSRTTRPGSDPDQADDVSQDRPRSGDESRSGLAEIGQVSVPVGDLERATTFYRDTLGVPFLFAAPGMAFFDCAGVRLLLTLPEEPEEAHRSSILYFRVGDIRQAHRRLAERGVTFEGGPHVVHRTESYELWMAFFRDSEDNVHALMSEARDGG